ncbi:MAG TPA: M67 family metallopeptidase [Novosphingobium sp.]|nr:M67 family metallopeptidase [Novosphingobium sp.]
MDVTLARGIIATLLAEAARAHPQEACGLLLGPAQGPIRAVVPCANVAADPARHFEIDPAALIAAHRAARGGGPAVLGYYHSHPEGPPVPSATDRAMACGDGRIWAIVGEGRLRCWRDGPLGFEALSTREIDG